MCARATASCCGAVKAALGGSGGEEKAKVELEEDVGESGLGCRVTVCDFMDVVCDGEVVV